MFRRARLTSRPPRLGGASRARREETSCGWRDLDRTRDKASSIQKIAEVKKDRVPCGSCTSRHTFGGVDGVARFSTASGRSAFAMSRRYTAVQILKQNRQRRLARAAAAQGRPMLHDACQRLAVEPASLAPGYR